MYQRKDNLFIIVICALSILSCSRSKETVGHNSGLQSKSILRLHHKAQLNGAGNIIGQVRDRETGKPLPGARIKVVETKYFCDTDTNGNYSILDLPTGTYKVQVEYLLHLPGTSDSLYIGENDFAIIDFELAEINVKGHFDYYNR